MCSIRIKMGETWTAPNPDSQDSSREKPKDPEGIWRPETLSEVLNPPPCSRRALQPPRDWRPPRASSVVSVSVGVIGVLSFRLSAGWAVVSFTAVPEHQRRPLLTIKPLAGGPVS